MKVKLCLLLLGVGLAAGAAGCRPAKPAKPAGTPAFLQEAPLAPSQGKLLDLAFDLASAIPADPHIKDRCLTQEGVVTACLQLSQPQRARRYLDQITDWRRGADYADLAFYSVQHGATSADVEPYLDKAEQTLRGTEDWQRDRIKVKMAKSRAYLGQTEQADQLAGHVEPAETGKVAGVLALTSPNDAFDEQMKRIDALLVQKHFDVLRNALDACVQLFDHFYADETRSSQVEDKVKAAMKKMPIFIQIDVLMALGDAALKHADPRKALELVNEAQHLIDESRWTAEHRLPLGAKLAALRFRAGDKDKAHQDADALHALFDAEGSTIVNVYRAGALRPLAEAYQVMGDAATALVVYKKALEAGVENPNSRPRAEDLAATCCSMAVHGVEPDAGLWQRMEEIQKGLGDPW